MRICYNREGFSIVVLESGTAAAGGICNDTIKAGTVRNDAGR